MTPVVVPIITIFGLGWIAKLVKWWKTCSCGCHKSISIKEK